MLQSCRDNNNRAVASVFKSSACHQRPAQIYYFNVSSFFRPTFFLSFSFCFSVLAYHFQIFTTYIMVSHLLLLFTASLFVQLCLCTPPCYSAFNGGGMTYVGGPGCKPPITSQAVGSTARSTLSQEHRHLLQQPRKHLSSLLLRQQDHTRWLPFSPADSPSFQICLGRQK